MWGGWIELWSEGMSLDRILNISSAVCTACAAKYVTSRGERGESIYPIQHCTHNVPAVVNLTQSSDPAGWLQEQITLESGISLLMVTCQATDSHATWSQDDIDTS